MRCTLFFLLILLSHEVFSQSRDQTTLLSETVISFHEIDPPEKSYYGFSFKKPFLIWSGFPSRTIYILNLKTDELQTISQSKGRGPLEVNWISDLAIHENYLYQFDRDNLKYLKLNLKSREMSENKYNFSGTTHPPIIYSAVSGGDNIIATDIQVPSHFVMEWNPENQNVTHYEMGDIDNKEEFPNPFFKESILTVSGNHLLAATNYAPYIYVFDIDKKRLIKRTEIGELETKQSKRMSFGGRTAVAPPDVSAYQTDIAAIPNSSNRVLVLKKGEDRGRSFSDTYIYEFDYMTGELMNEYPVGFAAEEIFWVGNDLYLYKEENGIGLKKIVDFNQHR